MNKFLIILLFAMITFTHEQFESPELKLKIDKTINLMWENFLNLDIIIVPYFMLHSESTTFRAYVRDVIEDQKNKAQSNCISNGHSFLFCKKLMTEIKKYYDIYQSKQTIKTIPFKQN